MSILINFEVFPILIVHINRYQSIDVQTSSKPTGFELIWTDAGSGADYDVKVYSLTPQPGYKCLGHVAVSSGTPSLSSYRCVRDDFVEYVPLKPYATWDDQGSGAFTDFAAYDIQDSSSVIDMGVFWSEARNHQPINKNVPALKFQTSVQCTYNC